MTIPRKVARRPRAPRDTTGTTPGGPSRLAVIVAKKFGLTADETNRLEGVGLSTLTAEARAIVANRSSETDVEREGPEPLTSGTVVGNDATQFVEDVLSEYVRSGGPDTQRVLAGYRRREPESDATRRDRIQARLDGTHPTNKDI